MSAPRDEQPQKIMALNCDAREIRGPTPLTYRWKDPEWLEMLANAAFMPDYEQLLAERPGQWVAYYGDRVVGFGPTEEEIRLECVRRGFLPEELFVWPIEQFIEEMIV